jgi:hypothetical protein
LRDLDILADLASAVSSEIALRATARSERMARAAAERAGEQMRFLAEASSVLAGSLDYQATLNSIARLAVPRFADWCLVRGVNLLIPSIVTVSSVAVLDRERRVVELAAAGIPAVDAVAAASWQARAYLLGGSGMLDEGSAADICVYAEDPRVDPRTLLDPARIILRGRVIR